MIGTCQGGEFIGLFNCYRTYWQHHILCACQYISLSLLARTQKGAIKMEQQMKQDAQALIEIVEKETAEDQERIRLSTLSFLFGMRAATSQHKKQAVNQL